VPRVPKKEVAINPINPRAGWDARFALEQKSSIVSSILIRLKPHLVSHRAWYFLILFQTFLWPRFSNRPVK